MSVVFLPGHDECVVYTPWASHLLHVIITQLHAELLGVHILPETTVAAPSDAQYSGQPYGR